MYVCIYIICETTSQKIAQTERKCVLRGIKGLTMKYAVHSHRDDADTGGSTEPSPVQQRPQWMEGQVTNGDSFQML